MENIEAIELLKEIGLDLTFVRRPVPVPADLRAEWRMAFICLAIQNCGRANKASLKKLHVLNWAGRSAESRQAFVERLNGHLFSISNPIRFDPALNRAIDLALGEGLLARDEKFSLYLEQNGTLWVDEIQKDKTCMANERKFFKSVGKRLSEKLVEKMLKPTDFL